MPKPTIEQLATLAARLPKGSACERVDEAWQIWVTAHLVLEKANKTTADIKGVLDRESSEFAEAPKEYPVSLTDVAKRLMPQSRPEDRAHKLRAYLQAHGVDPATRKLDLKDIGLAEYVSFARAFSQWLKADSQDQRSKRASLGGKARKIKLATESDKSKSGA